VGSLEADGAEHALRFRVPVTLHVFDVLDGHAHGTFLDALPVLPEVAVCASVFWASGPCRSGTSLPPLA
jgi:hypothetical protein